MIKNTIGECDSITEKLMYFLSSMLVYYVLFNLILLVNLMSPHDDVFVKNS